MSLRSSAGPATVRMPTPSSSRTMCARLVLPRPGGPVLLLQLEHDALGRLLADAGDRLEACRVLADDRAPQLLRGRAGDDRERDLRPDAVHRQELDEELALGAVGEAVELHRVLA